MAPPPNPPQAGRWGYIARAFVIGLVSLTFMSAFALAVQETHNPFFALCAIATAVNGLLQIKFIHNWFIDHAIPWLNFLGDHISRRMRQAIIKMWQMREIIFIFIILSLILGFTTPIPAIVHDQVNDVLCVQHLLLPTAFCGNGIQVSSIQVNNDSMNVGIIGEQNQDKAPFNQFDDHNDNAESNVEKLIFQQNNSIGADKEYVTLIVATTLSQTMSDPGISSSAGLGTLRGAYIAQYNYNQKVPDGKFPLKLLIANFGTKDVAATTVPQVMDQINLYAHSDPSHFIGVVGFPFSKLVTYALNERYRISRTGIPIISAMAQADHFVIDNSDHKLDDTRPGFYDNFYSIAHPVSDDSKVIDSFILNHLLPSQQSKTAVFLDIKDAYSNDLSYSFIKKTGQSVTEFYTVGKPNNKLATSGGLSEFDTAIKDISENNENNSDNKYNLIFFAGYADDFNILRNKLKANPTTRDIPIIGGEGLYYPYSTVYNKSGNSNNYANLFFTTDAAYAWTNEHVADKNDNKTNTETFPPHSPMDSGCATLPVMTPFTIEFCSWFNHADPPDVYGYTLAGHPSILMYDAVKFFLKAYQDAGIASPDLTVINRQLPLTNFEGLSGYIKYDPSSMDFRPVSTSTNFKPIDVACTDSEGHTHVVALYHVEQQSRSDPGSLHQDYFDPAQEDLCKAP